MAKKSVTEWDDVAGNNLDIEGINLSENMPPSYVNNAIREMMAQIKQWKDGYTDPATGLPVYQSQIVENLRVEGNANFKGGLMLNGNYGTAGQVIVSNGNALPPTWGNAFVRGMIMMWSGDQASVPTGWAVCSGSNGTPDLRDRFVIGAGSKSPDDTGGSADSVVVSHTHTASANSAGSHVHQQSGQTLGPSSGGYAFNNGSGKNNVLNTQPSGAHTHTVNVVANGVSGTNKNLPPYYALFYIMKL